MNDRLIDRPLQLCGVEMVQEEQAKYLGDQLSGLGLAQSVAAVKFSQTCAYDLL